MTIRLGAEPALISVDIPADEVYDSRSEGTFMTTTPLEPEDDGHEKSDTVLILDYLAHRLDPDALEAVEERARTDSEFRRTLADVTLMKSLTTLVLERNESDEAECRRIRRLFPAYAKGRTDPKRTALLSSHLDDCEDCDIDFEYYKDTGDLLILPTIWKVRPAVFVGLMALGVLIGAVGAIVVMRIW